MLLTSRSRTARPRRVALYVAERSEYAGRVLDGALRYVEDHVGLTLRDFQDDLTTPDRQAAVLAGDPPWTAWEPDGVVAILPHDRAAARWALRRSADKAGVPYARVPAGPPIVSVGRDFCDELPTVYIGAESVARLALEHFVDAGYESFGFVGVRGMVAVDHRRRCFTELAAARGHDVTAYELEANPWPGLYELEERAAAEPGLHDFLRNAPKPLAILCTSDYVGRAVLMACERLGLSVPGSVGVLGVDNYAAARACMPPLSSVQTPGEEVGYQAVALLEATMNRGPAAGQLPPVVVPATKLVARQSSGAGGAETEIVRALTLIRERACDGVGVEEILDDLAVSRSTLERQFLAVVGCTPGQELHRVRLTRAKELLRTTRLPVSRVAAMTGYERSSSFSDFFRRYAGISPRAYRAGGVADEAVAKRPASPRRRAVLAGR